MISHGFWGNIYVMSTILGAFGGYPPAPKIFHKLASYSVVQWLLVYILAYQGGGSQDPEFALVATVIAFIIYHLIIWMERDSTLIK